MVNLILKGEVELKTMLEDLGWLGVSAFHASYNLKDGNLQNFLKIIGLS